MKKAKSNTMTIKARRSVAGMLFFSPWIVGFLLFNLYPVAYSLMLSLNKVKLKTSGLEASWKGFEYFRTALTEDAFFPMNLVTTLGFIISATPVIVVFSIIISLLLNSKYPGRTLFRGIFFLPVIIISGPVVSELLSQNPMTVLAGNDAVLGFVQSLPQSVSDIVLYVLNNLVLILWFSGVQILIFLAGLQKIDHALYESAQIDGATPWECFWKITLPYLKPLVLINAIYTVVEIANFPSNQVNGNILLHMTDIDKPYSYSAAMSWIYFAGVMFILGFVFLILRPKREARTKI